MKKTKECNCGGYYNMSGWSDILRKYIYTCDKCGKKTTISYVPVESMSTKQYLAGIEDGLWGGVPDPKTLERIKNNRDNYWLMDKDEPKPEDL